jgi:D-serine deaminase-like pyridoxal phosphate-dependent protein
MQPVTMWSAARAHRFFGTPGYEKKIPDLPFVPAALVLARVVSKPSTGLLCVDLGHKALASEMPHPRVKFLNVDVKEFVTHSEEHMVIATEDASRFVVGDCVYGLPWHILPDRRALCRSAGR